MNSFISCALKLEQCFGWCCTSLTNLALLQTVNILIKQDRKGSRCAKVKWCVKSTRAGEPPPHPPASCSAPSPSCARPVLCPCSSASSKVQKKYWAQFQAVFFHTAAPYLLPFRWLRCKSMDLLELIVALMMCLKNKIWKGRAVVTSKKCVLQKSLGDAWQWHNKPICQPCWSSHLQVVIAFMLSLTNTIIIVSLLLYGLLILEFGKLWSF